MEAISRGGQIPSERMANQQTLHSLPTQPTPLVGRQREVATIVSLLRQEEVRLVTLSGPGGMGKTRLSLQVAGDLLNDFEHGVFFVALAAITDPDLVIPTIAATLEVKEGGQSIDVALRYYLADRHLLLVLDNLEQVIQAAPQIGKLLVAPRLKLLTTSREVLRLRGEYDYKVPPLRLPDLSREQNSASLSQYEAVTLFIQRAKAAQSDFIITDQNALAVAEICVRLDGLPLAIELAAARLQMFTPQAMLGKLSGRLKMLTGGARDLPARQQTLRSTIDWSYNLLKLSEQTLFARLAVFQGGRTVEAVEAICGPELDLDVTDGLESLLNKSMLQRADGPQGEPRFVMLETIREYAWERLRASGEAVALQRRHAEYFTAWVEQIEPELRAGPTQLQWFERLEAEYANLRTALDWSLADGNVDLGLRLVGSVWRFWWRQSHWLEWRRWTTRAFEQLEQTSPEVHAGVLMAVGMVRWVDQDFVEAKRYMGEALSLYRQLEDRTNIGWALVYLAWGSLGIADEYLQAITLVEEGLSLFRELGDKPGVAQALNVLGELARANGDYDRAQVAYEECLEIAQGTGDKLREQMQFGNLAAIAQYEGDYERAERLLKRALALARNKSSVIGTLQIMAGVVGARGYPQRSARLIGASEALYESIGDKLQPNEQADHERTILLLREQLGDEAFNMLRAKGRALSLEQTIEYAFKDED